MSSGPVPVGNNRTNVGNGRKLVETNFCFFPKTKRRGMKPCGGSRNAPGRNGRARQEAAREKTCMDKKTGKHSLHCGSAWLRAGTKKRSLRCGMVLHAPCVPERKPGTASAHSVCAFSNNGKHVRLFYAFRPPVLCSLPQNADGTGLASAGRRHIVDIITRPL